MKVQMIVTMGEGWPAAGGTIDLADDIAAELIERGDAKVPGATPKPAETAVLADGDDTAVVKRKPGRPRKAADAS